MLRINELFYSFQGEGKNTGTPCLFIRLSGCNLNCSFCDTDHTYFEEYPSEQVIDMIQQLQETHNTNLLVITGGEPLLQYEELEGIIDSLDCNIQIETNGSIKLPVLKNTEYVISPKQDIEEAFQYYKDNNNCYFKFLIENQQDIDQVKNLQTKYNYTKTIWLQPVYEKDKEVTEMILKNKLNNIKISGQLHKYLEQR